MSNRNPAFEGQVHAPEIPVFLPWLNTAAPLSLRELRGKLVLLDFWTYCCINCLHVLPELLRLERKYANELVVIGVHSAKFINERETASIRQAVLRHDIAHPVVNDAAMEVWRQYAVRAWPTLVLVNPHGKIIDTFAGEGNFEMLDALVADAIAYFRSKGELDETPHHFPRERDRAPATLLSFPGKVHAHEANQRLFISDTHHHRIVITDLEGNLLDVIGSGTQGLQDGAFNAATFNHPQGTALMMDDENEWLFICDTENHCLRRADFNTRMVTTFVGTGAQARPFSEAGIGTEVALNSPWDVIALDGLLFVAMAGAHQLWVVNTDNAEAAPFAGSGSENHVDGARHEAALAQPSGITTNGYALFFADSEVSSIRAAALAPDGQVSTVVGQGLFDFGDVDGSGATVRLQHPLGVTFANGRLYVADTYNHKIKEITLHDGYCRTYAGTGAAGMQNGAPLIAQFNEPGGISASSTALYVADTNNHAIRRIDLTSRLVSTVEIKGL